jgi:uncharacterized protein YcnI
MKRTPLLAGTAVVTGAVLALVVPFAASAHVTIGTNQADPGSYPLIDFRVPTESATATTTAIDITLPTDTPFGAVSVVPVEGWDAELLREDEVVTHVVFTAQPGHELTNEQYGVFPVLLGDVPDTGSIVLPVAQTYSDGTVVGWADTGEGAEHPAPVLYVTDEPASDHHDDGDQDAGATIAGEAPPASDAVARGLGIAGLVVGAVGVVVALTSRRRSAA